MRPWDNQDYCLNHGKDCLAVFLWDGAKSTWCLPCISGLFRRSFAAPSHWKPFSGWAYSKISSWEGNWGIKGSHDIANCSMPNRAFQQAPVDAFFGWSPKHCFNKQNTVIQLFLTQAPSHVDISGYDAAKAITEDSYWSEQNRKLLSDFAHRSMLVLDVGGGGIAGA